MIRGRPTSDRAFQPIARGLSLGAMISASRCLLCLALTVSTCAADVPKPAVPDRLATGFNAIRVEALRADVTFLASDALDGRLSLQRGDEVAAQWVCAEFAKAGLQPLVDGSYLQSVPLIEYSGDRASSYVGLSRGGAQKQWSFPHVSGGFKDDVDLTAPLVFAGFGITAPELGYDDYAGLDVRGKIVLLFDHEPQETDPKSIFNGTGNTRYATGRVKLLNAQAHGAAGVLLVGEPNRQHPSNQERVAKIGGSAKRSVPIGTQVIDDDTLRIPLLTVSDVIAQELLATSGDTPAQLQTAIDRDLKPQSRPLPDTIVSLRLRNASRRRGTTINVLGLLPGSDPSLAAETIIISAHHDHDGASSSTEIYHGADDNASGTAGVVALAHAFAQNPVRPKRSILFAVFAAEERGLLGAFWLAAHPLRPLATTRAMINFDMIGRNEEASEQTNGLIEIPADTSNRLNLIGAYYSPDYARIVAEENRRVGLILDDRFDHENALNVFFRSDQFPFVLKNIPAFWFFTGFHPDYHHVTDTADRLNYAKMAKIVQLSYLTAWRFTDDPTTPRFVESPRGQ